MSTQFFLFDRQLINRLTLTRSFTMQRRLYFALIAAVPSVLLSLSETSHAALLSIPTANVTASSEIPGFPRIDDHLVDGSGLVGGQHGTAPDGSMWLSAGAGFGGVDPDPSVTFDLGGPYLVTSFHVWNYNEAGGSFTTRGVDSVSVEYGWTEALGSTVAGITNFAQANGLPTYAGEEFNTFTPFVARFVKFDINTNHGDGSTFYGLSEVQFDGVSVLPEPSTGLLLIAGLVGLASRRRSRNEGARRIHRPLIFLVALASTLIFTCESVLAAMLPQPISPVVGTASTEFPGRTASDTVGGFSFNTGLTAGTGGVDPATGLVIPQHDVNAGNMWLTNNVEPAQLDFDLGSVFILDRAWIWNYNENPGFGTFHLRGIDSTGTVSTSIDGVLYTPQPSLSNIPLTLAPGVGSYDTPDVISFGRIAAQYVRFANLSSAGGDANFAGISEIIFFQAAVPEPSTGLLLIAGLIGLASRRRSRK